MNYYTVFNPTLLTFPSFSILGNFLSTQIDVKRESGMKQLEELGSSANNDKLVTVNTIWNHCVNIDGLGVNF